MARDAVIRDLGMSNVSAGGCWHVTKRAVRLISVVLGGEMSSVTGHAFSTEVGDTFFSGRLVVRIVAAGAGHGIPRLFLAHALRHGFDLTRSA